LPAAIVAVAFVLMGAGCKGKDGEGGITYVNYTSYGAIVYDDNPSIPGTITSGQEYACAKGRTYDVVIQTTCAGTLYTYGSYSCDQTDGESTLLIIPVDGEDDHNQIEVYDCGSYLADSVTPPGPVPTEADVVEGELHTATRTRGDTKVTFTWLYTRDPEVARGREFKPLSSQAGE
jgi:hypothetical protein